MAGTKTGNPGFINPVDNKVYTVDPVLPGDPSVNDSPPNPDPGELTVDHSLKDISKKTRVTLGTYLSSTTKGTVGPATKPNKYTIDASTDASLTSKVTENGYPVPPAPSKNTHQFAKGLGNYLSSDYAAVADKMKKGKASADVPDGNTLLPDASIPGTTNLVNDGAVDKYTAVAVEPNHWTPGGDGFTAGYDPSQPPSAFSVPLQSKATAVMPNEEAVTSPNAEFTRDLQSSIQHAVVEIKGKNDFYGNVSNPSNPPALVSTITNEIPSPLSPVDPKSDTVKNFASGLRNSYNEADYVVLKPAGANSPQLRKGKEAGTGPSGHEFLSNVVLNASKNIINPDPLTGYTAAAVTPNRWSPNDPGFTGGDDPLQPPAVFNVPLQSVALKAMPNEEVLDTSKFNLNISAAVEKSSLVTINNIYPVAASNPPNLVSTIDVKGYPVPPAPATNVNVNVHAPSQPVDPKSDFYLHPVTTEFYVPIAGQIKKGLGESQTALDGNMLLGSSIKQTPGGDFSTLNPPIQQYTDEEFKANDFNPNELYPIDTTEFVEIPKIVNATTKGTHDKSTQTVIKIDDLRLKPNAVTTDTKNYYPIDKSLVDTSSVTDAATKLPSPLSPGPANLKQFVDRKNINPSSNGVNNLIKGKASVNDDAFNGNRLLPDVTGNVTLSTFDIPGVAPTPAMSDGNPVNRYKGQRGSSILDVGNNRFASSLSGPNAQWQYAVDSKFNPAYKLADGTRVSALKMAQVGAGLSQRASAEIPGWLSGKFNPNGNGAELGAILPSVAQLGILKVNDQILAAKDVLDHLDDVEYDAGALTEIAPFGGQSWGTLTNVSEPYDDPSSIGLGITLIALIIAIIVLFEVLTFFNDNFGISSLLKSGNTLNDCVITGVKAFLLGANNADVSFGKLLLALLTIGIDDLVDSGEKVGPDLVVCRTIIRSGLILAEALSGIIKKFRLSAASGIKSLLGIVRIIKSSRLIVSIKTFALLGDTIFRSKFRSKVDSEQAFSSVNADTADTLPFSSFFKSRLSGSFGADEKGKTSSSESALAWSLQRSPSLYLLDNSTHALQNGGVNTALGAFAGAAGLKNYDSTTPHASRVFHSVVENGRISGNDRQKLEDALDGEYIPFSFHDVRTNEVISFHAFLASLTDDYSAHYDSVDAIGRVEPVKIYKGTTRKISMSFYVAATSPDDFDHMWFKINKLLTMVYPQYTAGRELSGNDYNFKAPFSQLMGASPLVRIRLGDLIRSNYSRFALARLFGMTDNTSNVTIDNKIKAIKFPEKETDAPSIENKLSQWKSDLPVGTEVILNNNGAKAVIDQMARNINLNLNNAKGQAAKNDILTTARDLYRARGFNVPDAFSPPNPKKGKKAAPDLNSITLPSNYTAKIIEPNPDADDNKYTVELTYNDDPAKTKRKFGFDVNRSDVEPTDKETQKKKQDLTDAAKNSTSKASSIDVLQAFMNPVNNAVVKSFESAGGKGLAGFIDTMNFDWHDKVKWEIHPGSAAPKICKVTISFTPIHDISPGIDHRGYNRAPVYPVGSAMVARLPDTKPDGQSSGG